MGVCLGKENRRRSELGHELDTVDGCVHNQTASHNGNETSSRPRGQASRLVLAVTGTSSAKLTHIVDKLVVETLSVIRLLVDK